MGYLYADTYMYFYCSCVIRASYWEALFSPVDAGIRVRFPSSRGPREEVSTTEVIPRHRRRKERGVQMNQRRQHAGQLAACVEGPGEAEVCIVATGIKYLYVHRILRNCRYKRRLPQRLT
jgi:hypothetical protein